MVRLRLVEHNETICYMYDFEEAVMFAEKLIANGDAKVVQIFSIADNDAQVQLRRIEKPFSIENYRSF